ncbi:asparagine synthase-related protein [Streptomyces sp. NPDC002454]|uniref:asparagine synthase-related protein n=1 Tax=Streptomyces sp. NPDC002490 TaxID=3154416 RepID=UPI003330F237
MLTLDLHAHTGRWQWDGARYRRGSDWLEPYAHPAVEHYALTDGTRTLVLVRERRPGRSAVVPGPRRLATAEYDKARRDAARWPLDTIIMETIPGRTTLTAGFGGVAPVYLAAGDGRLTGSWDMTQLRAGGICVREAARLLGLRLRYCTETAFTGVHRLTERATAVWAGGQLSFHMPDEAEHGRARELVPGAHVLDAYEELLEEVVDGHVYDPDVTSAHVSGGMDSAVIATFLAQRHPDQVRTSAILLPGAEGQQQRRRRGLMRARLPFAARDTTVDALDWLPLGAAGCRTGGQPVSPYEEPFAEATTALLVALARAGVRTVVTGVGGDEMVSVTSTEATSLPVGVGRPVQPWLGSAAVDALADAEQGLAPASVINEMTLLGLSTFAPLALRAGVWPVHPFADPRLIEFGEWLPRPWRSRKRLHRDRLRALGLGEEVAEPRLRESFAPVMERALTGPALTYVDQMLTEGSPLMDVDLVDPDGLASVRDRLRAGVYAELYDADLYDVLNLHLACRTMLT